MNLKQMFDESKIKWGLTSQILMLAEECSELSVASLHLLRNTKDKKASLVKFAEEITDVQFMIDEMVYYFKRERVAGKTFFKLLQNIRTRKEERLRTLLGAEQK